MPLKELERLQAVHRFMKLEISKDKELQDIVNFAADICGVPTALITLLDEEVQHIPFKIGFDRQSTHRQEAFCNYVIGQKDIVVVPDATLDRRFYQNPLVINDPNIRFYAGAPLTTSDGYGLGSLCVIDSVPRELTAQQRKMLAMLSRQVIQLLEFDSSLSILKEQFIKARKAEVELRSFFESSIDSHLLLGKDFEVLAFNKAMEREVNSIMTLNLTRGSQMGEFIHPTIKESFYLNYLRALKGTAIFEQQRLDHGGRSIHWVMKFEPALSQAGEIIGVCVNSSDVTLRVQHEEKVAVQSDSLNEIAFLQSHELRKPVASIMGLLNLIKYDGRADEFEEFKLMEQAIYELDEKIRMVVNHTSGSGTTQIS
ncbi:GAF domain-containing protein [Pedobacter sp. MC2016-14]|uniref:GAF domain-containing protein n=1 Tax=Pedobacter sp. MC2016-14 TaxID=2897327 RepID=UPI001E3F227E|nr:GAF domain-containing protein [Pedobacter sp. MC2016-14]MCD0487175.1 GAF domain-containing protein [Pedobacter sp. MC2016-14]